MSYKKKLIRIFTTIGVIIVAGILFWVACILLNWDIVELISSPKVIWLIAVVIVAGFGAYSAFSAPRIKG